MMIIYNYVLSEHDMEDFTYCITTTAKRIWVEWVVWIDPEGYTRVEFAWGKGWLENRMDSQLLKQKQTMKEVTESSNSPNTVW